ncbi:hypothetical protein [Candidatus Parabeggiatoa sp. HSG14]|uniref:hypothetical protein n=1 Tax=Candidatus Parabeggiatoa sp. HSG14 TaxID=3055593 RepID=UPI0025A7BEB3|nr:hypothetical protein [Thiotrichales bacterium HSG14]
MILKQIILGSLGSQIGWVTLVAHPKFYGILIMGKSLAFAHFTLMEYRMFIEISPHEGVLQPSIPNLELLKDNYRLNLNLVRKVFFEKCDAYERIEKGFIFIDEDRTKYDSERGIRRKYDTKKITLNTITFEIITSGERYDEIIILIITNFGDTYLFTNPPYTGGSPKIEKAKCRMMFGSTRVRGVRGVSLG